MAAKKIAPSAGNDAPTSTILLRKLPLIVIMLIWLFIFLSLVGFDRADWPSQVIWPNNQQTSNWCGRVGAWTAYHFFKLLGWGAWVGVLVSGLIILAAASGQIIRHVVVRGFGLAMMVCALSGLQNLLLITTGPIPDLAGGVLGTVANQTLSRYFGPIGSGLWLGAMLLVGMVVCMDDWLAIGARFGRTYVLPVAKPVAALAGSATLAAGRVAGQGAVGLFGSAREALAARAAAKGTPTPRDNDLDDDQPNLAGIREGADPAIAKLAKLPKPRVRLKVNKNGESEGAEAATAVADLDIADPDLPENQPGLTSNKNRKSKKRSSDDDDMDLLDMDESEDDGPVRVMDEDEEEREELRELKRQQAEAAKAAKIASKEAALKAKEAAKAASLIDDDDDTDTADADEDADESGTLDEEALRAKIAKLPVIFGQQNKHVASDADLRDVQNLANDDAYKFPPIDLLENPEENFNDKLKSIVQDQAVALEAALQQYKIMGGVVGIESGPVVTLYDVRLAAGTKVNQIQAVASDIARALKAVNIRIVANQVGRDTIGIEVPNTQKEKVRLKELMGKTEHFGSMKLPMFLGKDASGAPLIADLAAMPHMLIAGTTGSGKSVCMNTIIMSFLYTKKPSELKLVLVDPKMVELSQFKDVPHLMCPVVTDMNKAAAILEWAVQKMDERYELLSEAGCTNISGYNGLEWDDLKERFNCTTPEEEARIPRKLPYMVFMIDELADLMLTNKEVESSIIRIAQKARAVGIHLILATQRPQANVVTGLIKGNMPCRLTFKVASGLDSRIVLDQKGGELLLGQGDMLFLSPKTSKVSRAQGTLVDDAEIRKVVNFMKEVARPNFDRALLTLKKAGETASEFQGVSENNSAEALAEAQQDPDFEKAVVIVLETRRGSVSLLQRRLGIGYAKSSRFIDLMGMAGILGEHKGSMARDVVITLEDWNRMKELAGKVEPRQPDLFKNEQSLRGKGEASGRDLDGAPPWEEREEDEGTPFVDSAESVKKAEAEKQARRDARKPKDDLAAGKGFDPDNTFDADEE
jgi:S-DNA-T family DNA segregation ATPase FtsK/SpoIIIE